MTPTTKRHPMDPKSSNHSITYQQMIGLLDTSDLHNSHLGARGFTPEQIIQGQYKSMPMRRKTVISRLEQSGMTLEGVPGFWKNKNGSWQLAGQTGLMVPVRGPDGSILGLKIRSDKDKAAKYTQLSSNPKPDKDGDVKYPFGTAATIYVHHPAFQPQTPRESVLRITEGELKADIATLLTGIYTLSLPGVGVWEMVLKSIADIKPKKILLAFDSDKNKEYSTSTPGERQPFAVARSLASLYLSIKEAGIDVEIETWEEEWGKGIDDVLVGGHEDKITTMSEKETETFVGEALKGDMPLEWVYIIETKRFINTVTYQELDKEQFSDKFAIDFKKAKASDVVLKHPGFPKVDRPTYWPAQPQIIEEGNLKLFNFWSDTGAESEDGSVKMFLNHCEYILPDIEERNQLLDWLAYNVQNPGEKIHWALLLQGIQGTGKSYFGFVLRKIFGERNVSNPSNESIHELYTGWQKSCQLVVIEELMARGRLDLMNKLKPMITEKIAIIREMYKGAYEQTNRFNILIFTNYEDAIIIDETDRRYEVHFSPAKPRDPEYYNALWEWTESHAGAIKSFLLARSLEAFQPKGHAPMTRGKRIVIEESTPPLEYWILSCLEDQAWPFQGDLISTRHLMICLPRRLGRISETLLARILKKTGCRPLKRVKLDTGESVRLWTVRRHEIWEAADTTKLTDDYQKWSSEREPGGNPMKDAEPL